MRILLFGAYGNGNFGDDLCLAAVVHQLRQTIPDCQLTVSPFRPGRVNSSVIQNVEILNYNIIDQIDRVNTYDALVIGPGGLFEWPHQPFIAPGWCDDLRIPVALFSVGVWPHHAYGPLFRKAIYLGLRDHASLKTAQLSGGAGRSFLLPDPVLASDFVQKQPQHSKRYDTGFALRQWLPQAYDEDRLVAALRVVATDRSLFLALEEGICGGASDQNDAMFGSRVWEKGDHVSQIPNLNAIIPLIGQCERFIGMRYHGCILALTQGIPVAGISYLPKVRSLFAMMGMDVFCAEPDNFSTDWLRERPWGEFAAHVEVGMAQVRDCYTEALDTFQMALQQAELA